MVSDVVAIAPAAQTKPGPGAYHSTLTFAEELTQKRYLRSMVKSPRKSLEPLHTGA